MALVVWRTGTWKLEIVKRSDVAGFEVLPKRWIVERTFAWISRNRRLARDFERYAITVAAGRANLLSALCVTKLS
jgi:transposase